MTVQETAAPFVVGVSKDCQHRFSKLPCESITLLEGLGVEGDAHAGITVQHRSRVAGGPHATNLRQVHLIHSEFFDGPGSRDTNWPRATLARMS